MYTFYIHFVSILFGLSHARRSEEGDQGVAGEERRPDFRRLAPRGSGQNAHQRESQDSGEDLHHGDRRKVGRLVCILGCLLVSQSVS